MTKSYMTDLTYRELSSGYRQCRDCHRAAEWGSLKGRFVVDGTPPKPAPLVVTKDQFCIDKKPINESVVVGPKGELANAVVFLRVRRAAERSKSIPTIAAQAQGAGRTGQQRLLVSSAHRRWCASGQPFVIKNSDPVGHNTNYRQIFSFNQIDSDRTGRKTD